MTQVSAPVGGRGYADALLRRTEWLVTKPRAVAAVLAGAGLVVWHAWLTTMPLTSGDWNWQSPASISGYFPFPSIWNSTLGLAGENRFVDAFRFPVYALDGFLSAVGAPWTVIEKAVYFIPYAVLLPIAGWLLAREILGATRWAILAPVLLLGNAYLVMEANTEVPLTLAEVCGCFALLTFIWTMKRLSLRWGLITGLLISLSAALDVRPAYLTVLLIVGYVLILAVGEPSWPLIRRRLVLAAAAGVVFAASEAFWLLPLLMYHGSAQLPIPPTPNFNISTLEHGIAGVSSFWDFGRAADLVQAPLNPWFMVLPVMAMLPLLGRRLKLELLWLALAAVVCAFLAKTNTAPFGAVYDWLYTNVPGFNLFREGSKFLYPVAIAYAILIPAAFRSLVDIGRRLHGARQGLLRGVTLVMLALVLGVTGSVLLVLEQGKLGLTTTPVAVPRAFSEISSMLASDQRPGAVLWLGSPVYKTSDVRELLNEHRYVMSTSTHPIANLSGNAITFQVNRRDSLQYFCPVIKESYCYLSPSTFPYLANMVGASYILSPASFNVGKLRPGVTRQWVQQQLVSMYGPPEVLGDPGAKVLLWRVHSTLPAVATYPAVALVDSGPWSLPTVLPALRAMGLPAAYRQSLVGKTFPPAPADLPDAVTVFPRVNGGCQSAAAHRVAVMAESTSPTLALQVDGTASHLGLLARSARLPGWGAYGPVTIPAGLATITTPSGGPTVGPCVAWSPLAAAAFGAHANITGPVHVGAGGEQVKATTVGTGGPWVELRRGYDVGWHLDGKHPTAVGDGLFNLYYDPGAGVRHYTFTFSTHIWERLGELISLMALLGTVALIWVVGRRERRDGLPVAHEIVLESRVAPLVGALGMVFLGLTAVATTLSWFGFPSHLPGTAITSNPYTLDVLFGSMALVLLALSMLVRLGENAVRLRHVRLPTFVRRHPNGAIAVVLSGCLVFTLAVGVVQNHRHSPNKVPGATLIEGKVAQQQKNGALCIADYTFALKAYAALPSAYVQRARCYLTSGQDAAGAVHDLDHALALTPDDPIYLFLRAEADTATGNVSRARADYLSAAHSPASTPNQLVSVVDGLIGIGELDAAQQVVNLALNRFPGDPIALLAAVDLDVASGNGNQAASDLAQAEEAAGSDSSALGTVLSRACTFEVSRLEYRAALTTCQRSVALNHQLFGAYDGLGVAEAAMGHLDQAIVSASSAIGAFEGAVGPNSQPTGVDGFGLSNLYEARGRLYAENNQPKLAVADFRSALAVLPAGNPNTVIEIRGEITAAQREQA